jgi:hypothetical protein
VSRLLTILLLSQPGFAALLAFLRVGDGGAGYTAHRFLSTAHIRLSGCFDQRGNRIC